MLERMGVISKVGEEGRFHGGAQSIALRVEGFAQSDALRSAPTLNHAWNGWRSAKRSESAEFQRFA